MSGYYYERRYCRVCDQQVLAGRSWTVLEARVCTACGATDTEAIS